MCRAITAFRSAGIALLLVVALPGRAQDLAAFSIEFPAAQSQQRPVAPGATTTLAFTVRSASATSGIAVVRGSMGYNVTALDGYTFVASAPAHCPPPVVVYYYGHYVQFRVGPLAPGESLGCSYQVARAADSRSDLAFNLCSRGTADQPCSARHWFGTVPALALQVDPAEAVTYGASSLLMRITARNPTGRAIAQRVVGTECSEFGGGLFAPAPFEVETDLPGACLVRSDLDQCANFTGQNFSSTELQLGPIPANGSASCLVRLRFPRPLTGPAFLDLNFYGEALTFADGGIGLSPTTTDGSPAARLGASPPIEVPVGRWGLLPLGLLMLAAARPALRQP